VYVYTFHGLDQRYPAFLDKQPQRYLWGSFVGYKCKSHNKWYT